MAPEQESDPWGGRPAYERLAAAIREGSEPAIASVLDGFGSSGRGRFSLVLRRLRGLASLEDLLTYAVEARDRPMIRRLVAQGALPGGRGGVRGTPLQWLARSGDLACLDDLMHGDVTPAELEDLLAEAVIARQNDLVQVLLRRGVDPQSCVGLSLFRLHGSTLRLLAAGGARFPSEIVHMLERRVALGDHPDDPQV